MSTAGPLGPVVTATITPTGVLTVWGLDPAPTIIDEGAPPAARNALVNLLRSAALDAGAPVCAAARTPAGPWYFVCDVSGVTSLLDPVHFAGIDLPELDAPVVLAGAAAVFAAAASSPPEAMLALASDPDPAIRAQALAELATWPDDPTPVADAELPAERLERLARCDLGWVRVGVAGNPGTGHTALAHLVADPDPQVLRALAGVIDLPAPLLVQLASNPDPGVQAELRRNPSAAFLTEAKPLAPQHSAPPAQPAGREAAVPLAEAGIAATAALILDPNATPDGLPSAQDPLTGQTPGSGPTAPRLPRRALGVVGAATAVVLLAGGGYAAVSALDTSPATAASVSATAQWNGMSLPAGPEGPTDPAGDVAAGFAHSELGAAMAAAHLSVRIDPFAGPASFEPTITGQTFGGDPGGLLAATRDRYTSLGGDGGPIPTTTGQITGWRIEGWTPDAPATVHLRVASPGGTATDYGIAVVWSGGDYLLVDPTSAGTFTTRPADDPATYRSF